MVFLKLTFLKPISSNLKEKKSISRDKLSLRFFRFFTAVNAVQLYGNIYLAFLTLFISYMSVSCRHSATIKAYDNGTSKDHGGNEINSAGSDTSSFKVAIIVLVLVTLILVLCGIIFYIERKRRRGIYFI